MDLTANYATRITDNINLTQGLGEALGIDVFSYCNYWSTYFIGFAPR